MWKIFYNWADYSKSKMEGKIENMIGVVSAVVGLALSDPLYKFQVLPYRFTSQNAA